MKKSGIPPAIDRHDGRTYFHYSNRRDALGLTNDVLGAIERRIANELEFFIIPHTVRVYPGQIQKAHTPIQ